MAPTPDNPSPEFRFVCAACRWPRAARDGAVCEAAAVPGIDWSRVAQITKRHRVWGLVADAVRASKIPVPLELDKALSEQAGRIARQNLGAAAETKRLGAMLDAAGIDWITFKGLPVAIQGYGNLSVKTANDIDILIPVAGAERTAALFREAGYVRFSPGPEIADDQVAAWMQVSKETGWRHPGNGLIVELHSRLLQNPALLPQAALDAPRKRIAIAPGLDVPTMGDALLFPYLFAHGAHHGWFRLKWLADVNALLAADPLGPETRYREAKAMGVGRCAAQGLLLLHEMLGLDLSPAFAKELRADAAHRRLVRIAKACLGGEFEAKDHASPMARSMLPVLAAGLLLRPGIGYKLSELGALAANPADRATGRLPKSLSFLYPVLGGVRWTRRMLGRKP
ncbi:nucleotidyltransferase family protein [Sphingomonas sp. AOB5]|uniref:nucleotidyltransferase domain-containing protein n=1 Tax=Sphingomonas sp. AOB5 TaxID=3034017 RepID=UPI0023F8FD24|nr:nucleotidyltransferase family protein [Sphingomonas sp. AOB5]MDF7774703.1 nucleotidyltransferase family protein [Sphingomonas sp. AOB5]